MRTKTTLLLCTALAGFGTAAMAVDLPAGEVTREAIEAAYAGYERIEIKYSPTQVKVEAIDAETQQKVETVYDRASGTILETETEAYEGAVSSGVQFVSTTEEFVDVEDDDVSGADEADDDASGVDDASADDVSAAEDDTSAGSDDSDSSAGSDGGDGGDSGDSSAGDDSSAGLD